MLVINCEQLSDEWFSLRCGVPSASKFGQIITPTGKKSTQSEQYLNQLAGERLTGIKSSITQSQAMLEGIEKEEEARDLFSMIHGLMFQR